MAMARVMIMVGALADWFAVVALFRHPLGLQIPHTAIIPNRKDEIGDNLWNLEGEIDLEEDPAPEGPLVRLRRIGC